MTKEIYKVTTRSRGGVRDEYTVVTERGLEGAIEKVKQNNRFYAATELFVSVNFVSEVDQ